MSAITTIPTTTVDRLRTLASELDQLGKTALEKAIEAGNLLRECKDHLPHGTWLDWLSDNFQFTHKTAMNWMGIAEASKAGKLETVSTLTEAYHVISAPKKSAAHVSNNSGENEWHTPPQFIQSARAVMGGIDLDPASSEIANRTVEAIRYFTKEVNGLAQSWGGNVWLNPPYAQPLIGEFAEKITNEVAAGTVKQAVVLVNNASETKWFQRMAGVASAICLPSSRIKFLDPQGNPGAPLQGQALIYFGPNVSAFTAEFSQYGTCSGLATKTEVVAPSPAPIAPDIMEVDEVDEVDHEDEPTTESPFDIAVAQLPKMSKGEITQLLEILNTRWT